MKQQTELQYQKLIATQKLLINGNKKELQALKNLDVCREEIQIAQAKLIGSLSRQLKSLKKKKGFWKRLFEVQLPVDP